MLNKRAFSQRRHGLAAIALVTLLQGAGGARADEPGTPSFSLSGFGTLGMAHSTEDQADFTNSPLTKPNGTGYSGSWSADLDTRLGLQVIANLTPQVSAVLQVLSQQRYDNTYRPSVEWANIKYAVTPDFSVRLGRIAMPTYLVGDYRYVGYSTAWVRPPVALYGLIPITSNDGVDASYRLHFGEATSTFQGSYGNSDIELPNGAAPGNIRNALGIFNTTEYGPATFHMAYQEADISFGNVKPLFDAFRQFGPAGVALADKYDMNNTHTSLLSFGAIYDPGNWFAMGEWSKGRFSSFVGTQTAWYVSSGVRIGAFTPFVIYAKSDTFSNTSDPGLNLATLPPFLVGSAAALNAGLNSLLQATTGQTVSLGSRWDFKKNAALKLQYDHISLDANSSGLLLNTQPGFRPGGTFNVFSVTVDFVF